ncbi:MAG: efflux RND transporter periplasmic adaptor subunit [Gammaproteobacteria bacterium]|nr:efflux RND transporter periplasmic adaptor subunit [Gammaproteobacteria bacterium]
MSQELPDKKALLHELRIDREVEPEDKGRPLKWFLLIALVAGVGFVLWFFQFPGGTLVPVNTAIAQASQSTAVGASVLDATGYVVARRQATVSSKVTGKVVEVLIEEGVFVQQGQLLARLDDSIPQAQLRLAESQLEAARRSLDEMNVLLRQAELDLRRTRGLAERKLASQADLDRDGLSVEGLNARLDRARQEIVVASRGAAVQRQIVDDMLIRAPFDGVVIAKAAQPGEMISPLSAGGGFTRTGICTIVDMDSLEVEVDVNEAYINRVYSGQPVQITLNAYPEDHFPAEVIAIIPAADRNKATVRVRVGFLERDDRVLPDMGVRVAFLDAHTNTDSGETPAGVLVPSRAIAKDASGPFVFVVMDKRVQRRAITVGDKQGSRSRVLAGLNSGERIVASLSEDVLATLSDGDEVVLAN